MDPNARKYLADIGRRGGLKSRRSLSPEQARKMVHVREARRAYMRFHTSCFWPFDASYRITVKDVEWVAQRLMEFGGRAGWELGARLCR
jgi:hypothetical protein